MSAGDGRRAIAIVGLGPRGTYALERLLDRARSLPPEAGLEITAFEPHPAPGAGPVYDPSQPPYLRMNFAAELVDMWCPDKGLLPSERRLPFSAWRRSETGRAAGRDGDGASQPFPPRAEVGAYLEDGLRQLLAAAPASARIAVERAAVRALRPLGDGWELELTTNGEAGPGASESAHFDEVLLCTGHLPGPAGGPPLEAAAPAGPARIESVYPVERLSPQRVPAGSRVGVRGFALTFIDAALALSEGRGGRFLGSGEGADPLRYEADGAEPVAIHPYSRSGRPMLAKPGPGLAASLPGVTEAGAAGRERLLGGSGSPSVAETLLPQLAVTAERLLAAAGVATEPGPAAELGRLLAPSPGARPDPAVREQLRRSIEIGAGRAAPDAAWALGQSWRSLYPAIVERFGADRMRAREWPAFRRLALEMERIAFGPPLVNAAKLLALIDAGLVRLGEGPHLPAAPPAEAQVLIDAVSPPPGAAHLTTGPIGGLLERGLLRIPPGRRGIELGPEAQCIAADGDPVPGLAALGRISEDWVIGNDTLNRRLHPHPDRWAKAVVRRASDQGRPARGARVPPATAGASR